MLYREAKSCREISDLTGRPAPNTPKRRTGESDITSPSGHCGCWTSITWRGENQLSFIHAGIEGENKGPFKYANTSRGGGPPCVLIHFFKLEAEKEKKK